MPCTGIQTQPTCCCTVAFETATTAMVGPNTDGRECLGNKFVINALSLSLEELKKYKILFLGPMSVICNETWYLFTTPVSLKIKSWVEAGGRLYASGVSPFCFDQAFLPATPNFTRYNNFLGFLGTSIQMSATPFNGCNPSFVCYLAASQNQPIMQGFETPMRYITPGTFTGGISLAKAAASASCPDNTILVGEPLGDGVVIAGGSGAFPSIYDYCDFQPYNCTFFKRLCSWNVNDMFE